VPKKDQEENSAVCIISLGCVKNTVDSEYLLGLVRSLGYQPVSNPELADIVIINTCTFIQAASEESINTILDAASLKEKGVIKKIIVTGCLAQRYAADLAEKLPEVDAFTGTGNPDVAAAIIRGSGERIQVGPAGSWTPSDITVRESSGPVSYLKIGDGCSRKCSFCIIPLLKGPAVSKRPETLLEEARMLVEKGSREICLVAQDTADYGRDLGIKNGLVRLVDSMRSIPHLRWLRLLYVYPTSVNPDLVRLLEEGPPVVPYLDIPVQHADARVLKKMRRGYGPQTLYEVVKTLRKNVEGITLRTTVLVGHPGEDDAAFENLVKFLKWARFERLGVFRFSSEDGTDAAGWKAPSRTASYNRFRKVRSLGRRHQAEANERLRGSILEVLVEGPDHDAPYLMQARHRGQAPDVDGVTHLADAGDLEAGDIIRAEVEDTGDYDIVARRCK